MALGGMNIPGSLGPSYFKALKEEEAKRAILGMEGVSSDTLYGATGKALGGVYGERMKSLQASHQQKYGQQQLDIGERRLAIEEEAEKNRQKAQMWSGIGSIVGTAAGFIPAVGPLLSAGISAGTKALTSTQPMSSGWIQPSSDEYYGGFSGPEKGIESNWPDETRFIKMGSNLLWGSGGK